MFSENYKRGENIMDLKNIIKNENTNFIAGNFEINDNCLKIGNTIIQISNISRIWLGIVPKASTPAKISIILFILSTLCFFYSLYQVALIGIIISGIILFYYYKEEDKQTFNIRLSSGETFVIETKDNEIGQQALEVMINCFNNTIGNQFVQMNLRDGKIEYSDNRDYSDKRTYNNITINYSKLSEELPLLIEELKKHNIDNNDIQLFEEILIDAKKKDGKSIKDKLKKISNATVSEIGKGLFSAATTEIFKYLCTTVGIPMPM